MKKTIKLILLFVLFFVSSKLLYSFCTTPEYTINNYCIDSDTCYETSDFTYNYGDIYPNFLDNISTFFINHIDDYVNDRLDDYVNYRLDDYVNYRLDDYVYEYGWNKFKIYNYCSNVDEDDADNCSDYKIKIDELFNHDLEFSVYDSGTFKKYEDGKDYFFSEFENIITQLDEKLYGFSASSYELSEFNRNILDYRYDIDEGHQLLFKNLCQDLSCDETGLTWISINSDDTIKLLRGSINSGISYLDELSLNINDEDISYTNSSFRAGSGSTNISFSFSQRLPNSGCASMEYVYNLKYKYEGDLTNTDYLEESLFVNYNGTIFGADGAIINTSLNGDNILKVDVEEPITLTKAGNVYFYLSVTDFYGNLIEDYPLNHVGIEVFPGTPVTENSYIELIGYDESTNYYPGDTFNARLHLKDVYGNDYYEADNGISISYVNLDTLPTGNALLFDGTSSFIDGAISGIKSHDTNSSYFPFTFKFEDVGYYNLDFNINFQDRDWTNSYNGNYENIDLLWTGGKIFIVSSVGHSDIAISCTNGNVTLRSTCIADNLSGCNPSANQILTFTNESDNGSNGFITISDNAYNQKSYAYTMDHIDKTPPTVSFLNMPSGNVIASGSILEMSLFDPTTLTCRMGINYKIYLNGDLIIDNVLNSYQGIISLDEGLLSTVRNKDITIYLSDFYGNSSGPFNYSFNVVPDFIDPGETNISLITPSSNSVYANNNSIYNYKIVLKDKFGNPISNKSILGLNQVGTNTIKTNMLDNTGNDSIIETGVLLPSNGSGEILFGLKSYAPGTFDEKFEITMSDWDKNYNDTGVPKIVQVSTGLENKFLKPIKGDILVSNDDGSTWNTNSEIGTKQKYKIDLDNIGSLSSYSSGYLNISEDTIKNNVVGHIWQEFDSIDNIFGDNASDYVGFHARINVSDNNALIDKPDLFMKDLEISYKIGGETVSYYLDDKQIFGNDVVGVKIEGSSQSDGKDGLMGHKEDFSNISGEKQRSEIRENAYRFIKSINDGDIVNGVKYKEGDYEISGDDLGYETLVVRNGNVIIGGNLNSNGKKLGIIVLNDDYNVINGFNQSGNVFINEDVKYIDAVIYSDGGIISSNNIGIPFTSDSIDRTSKLSNQLIIKGSLFTKNTIAGAILGDTGYKLPGGIDTSNFNKAMIYDLNYIRRGNNGCDKNSNGNCLDPGEYEEYFIIKYNPRIQSDPPKLFSK